MERLGAGTILLAVVAAGLLAGLAVGLFHYVATEPVIEQAIAIEEAAHPEASEASVVVTRDMQRAGGVVGWVLIGACWALAFGAVYTLVRPRFGRAGTVANAILAALAAYWLVVLFPFLKYPANPPGVGDPETVVYREVCLVLFWVLSIGGVLAAGWLDRLVVAPRWSGARRWLVVGGAYALYAVVLFIAMPANPDPVEMPAGLVTAFRALSLVGLTLFWLLLGVTFGLFARGLQRNAAPSAR
jgi:hypothetical protein